jgi:hypothetical protein
MFDGEKYEPDATAVVRRQTARGLMRAEVIERMRERLRFQQEFGPPRPVRCACCGR